jgi:uncharacterized membrane protein
MRPLYVQRYLLTGLLTFIPIWLTWIVFKSIFSVLSQINLPWIAALFDALAQRFPESLGRINQGWLISLLAFIVTVGALYLMGFAANRVFGRRLLGAFEMLIERIPIAHTIYSGTKKLMSMLQNKPSGTQRVVLIAFPSPELRTIGFVTRVFQDSSGAELAAVYVPTTPNPTGGYLEIVPIEHLIATDWSVDQAMAFILSAGAAGPDVLPFKLAR